MEIKTCPFCGKPPQIDKTPRFNSIFCNTGKCLNPSTGSWVDYESALEIWNMRANEVNERLTNALHQILKATSSKGCVTKEIHAIANKALI